MATEHKFCWVFMFPHPPSTISFSFPAPVTTTLRIADTDDTGYVRPSHSPTVETCASLVIRPRRSNGLVPFPSPAHLLRTSLPIARTPRAKALRSTRRQLSAVWAQSPRPVVPTPWRHQRQRQHPTHQESWRLLRECQTATAFQQSTCREECTSSRRCLACCLHCLTWPRAASPARDRRRFFQVSLAPQRCQMYART